MSETKRNRSYLASVMNWKIRNMIEGYLRARYLFKSQEREAKGRGLLPLDTLREICDILYEVKEDHHLIFRRGENEAYNRNGNHKLVPGLVESAFIDNVGLLFHKALVARELRYLLEHYSKDDELWESHFASLKDNLDKISRLFDDGIGRVLNLMRAHAHNILLFAFLVENSNWVCKCLNLRRTELIKQLCQDDNCERVYIQVADYYMQSGWYDKAQTLLQKVLKTNPQNAMARQALKHVSSKVQI